MSRTKRFLSAVSISYLNQALIMATGLWLTPFLLYRVGQQEYGLWLVGLQFTLYLTLLDIGIVAVLPRTVAFAVGQMGGINALESKVGDLPDIIGQTMRLVLWQVPAAALLAGILFGTLPAEWALLREPLGLIILGYVVLFPFRVLPAILQGLQDITFIGVTVLVGWVINTSLTIILVLMGWGLQALAIGWLAQQTLVPLLCLIRLRGKFRQILPHKLPHLTWQIARDNLSQGLWVSVAQIAQLLLNGTDIVIITKLLGAEAAVPYACTSKLISVLANQPQMLLQQALPALSELRMSATSERLWQVMSALSLAMVGISGAVTCVVLATNQGFVTWWVGASQYGGMVLTLLFLLVMMLRHWNGAWVLTMYCFGYERRIALTNLVDGVVTIIGTLMGVAILGPIGAPLGAIMGACLTSLPSNLSVLIYEVKIPLSQLLGAVWPWAWRFVLLASVSLLCAHYWIANSLPRLLLTTTLGVVIYMMVMVPMVLQSSLAVYLQPLLSRLGVPLYFSQVQKNPS